MPLRGEVKSLWFGVKKQEESYHANEETEKRKSAGKLDMCTSC